MGEKIRNHLEVVEGVDGQREVLVQGVVFHPGEQGGPLFLAEAIINPRIEDFFFLHIVGGQTWNRPCSASSYDLV